jgi:hypothetical protein
MNFTFICPWCGRQFVARKPARRFCSRACLNNYRATKRKAELAASADERFWAKVNKSGPDDCWEWAGYCRPPSHYGQVSYKGTLWSAHRLSWFLTHGPIPDGLWVCHHCDNPRCVNPAHLFLGTPHENFLDAAQKGRMASGPEHGMNRHPERRTHGERNGCSRLTSGQVLEIRSLFGNGAGYRELATRYGVSDSCIRSVAHRVTWRHI